MHFFKQILLIASLPTASSGTTKPINVSCLATLKLRIIERESEKGVDISGTTKPIDVNSTLCAATLTLRIIKRVSKKGVMITATNNQF